MAAGCGERAIDGERELVVPGWLAGTWSVAHFNGDLTLIEQFAFLDEGEVMHVGESCWASDTGESPPSYFSAESSGARWVWGAGEEVRLLGANQLQVSQLNHGLDELVLRPDPLDCRVLVVSQVTDAGEFERARLEFADLCFLAGCSSATVFECSESPAGCPGD
jgi:hypothetical protein